MFLLVIAIAFISFSPVYDLYNFSLGTFSSTGGSLLPGWFISLLLVFISILILLLYGILGVSGKFSFLDQLLNCILRVDTLAGVVAVTFFETKIFWFIHPGLLPKWIRFLDPSFFKVGVFTFLPKHFPWCVQGSVRWKPRSRILVPIILTMILVFLNRPIMSRVPYSLTYLSFFVYELFLIINIGLCLIQHVI